MLKTASLTYVLALCSSSVMVREAYSENHAYDILILVDESIRDAIQESLNQYKKDLASEGWTYYQQNMTIGGLNASEVKANLTLFWENHSIEGCVLIGDFPYAEWEKPGQQYATDYYYMDLDGNWTDTDGDGLYDKHTNETGDIAPEIWVGRIMASNVDGDEPLLINNYFTKNHAYRTNAGSPTWPRRALTYMDNGIIDVMWTGAPEGDLERYLDFVENTTVCLKKAYVDVTCVYDTSRNGTNTNATDYMYRLNSTDGYEFVWLGCHGHMFSEGGNHAFSRLVEDSGGGEGMVYWHFYLNQSPKAFFYIWDTCHAAEFNSLNCLGGSAIFGNGWGLVSIGMTAAGYPQSQFFSFFDYLKQHKCIGEAIETVYNITLKLDIHESKKWAILGDPTLRLSNQPPFTPCKPWGPESGNSSNVYTYFANTTDFDGEDVQYEFFWGDGTTTITDFYASGLTVNASHAWNYSGYFWVKVRAHDGEAWSDWSPLLLVTIDGGGGGCPFVYVWNGTQYVIDNNLLAASVSINGTEVEDHYRLEQTLVPFYEQDYSSLYSLLLSEFQQEHSYLDQAQLIVVDHQSGINVAVSPYGEILTYKNPNAPVSAVDEQGISWLQELNDIDSNYYEGHNGSYLILNFGEITAQDAKLVIRADRPPTKWSIHIQVLDSVGNWIDVVTIIPRTYWATEIIDLSSYLPSTGEFKVRLYFTDKHKVDYVGLDTTPPAQIEVQNAQLLLAYHSEDGDVTKKLLFDDNIYSELVPGQQIALLFVATTQSETQRTFIINVKGYYIAITG